MADISTCTKRPGESRLYTFDFSNLLSADETLSGVSSATANTPTGASALTLGSPALSGDDSAVVRISGGTSGYIYSLTVTVTTSASNTLVGCGHLHIQDC